jgi:hypothetical protein
MRPLAAIAFSILVAMTALAQEPPAPQPAPPTPVPGTPPPPEPQPAQPQPAQPVPQPAPPTTAPQPAPVPEPAPQPQPQPQPEPPSVLSRAAGASYDRRDSLPNVNIYLPEGQADIRLRKLIKNVLFESQISYRFINGNISTFLRYKYYAQSFTYKLSVFDTIEFDVPGVGGSGSNEREFQRVRGGLFLMEFPRDYNHRYYWGVQDDRLTFGDVQRLDNRKNNIYTKIGYQYGTQFDEHLNGIVGESRGRVLPVLTAFREIGPQKLSFAAALTQSAKIYTGDYRYTKFEAEALRRWDITPTSFIVTRAHTGLIPFRTETPNPGAPGPDLRPQIQRYSVPEYEMFRLGGREALRSVKRGEDDLGTALNEFHMTNEYFVPVFRNRDYKTWIMHWNTLYAIGYAGVGNVGYRIGDIAKVKDFAADAGLGAEASIAIRDFDVLLSVIAAHTIRAPESLKGNSVKFSIRTIR